MKDGKTSAWKLAGLCLLVMVGLPLAFRLWMTYDPPTPAKPLAETFAAVREVRQLQLLAKPLGEWTANDVSEMPRLHAWLKERADKVLPWEWTSVAREKDSAGYCEVWVNLLKDVGETAEKAASTARWQSRKLRLTGRAKGLLAKWTGKGGTLQEQQERLAAADRETVRQEAVQTKSGELSARFQATVNDGPAQAKLADEACLWLVQKVVECE